MKQTGKTIHLITVLPKGGSLPIYMLIDYGTNSSTEWTSTPSPHLTTRMLPIPSLEELKEAFNRNPFYGASVAVYQVTTTIQEEYPELFI